MKRRPLVALHKSTGTYTLVAGRNPPGRVNAEALAPPAMAPLSCTMPPMVATPAAAVPYGACVQPFWSDNVVEAEGSCVNQAPSSEVKHCASENAPLLVCTLTSPLGWMTRRPSA